MAWVLVKWLEEDALGVIPSAWVVEPASPIPTDADLPVKGICYWKRKSSKWEALILASSGETRI